MDNVFITINRFNKGCATFTRYSVAFGLNIDSPILEGCENEISVKLAVGRLLTTVAFSYI